MGIRFDNVTYRYEEIGTTGHLGLDELTLELQKGCFIAVLGVSGSGKSTLLQHMNGLLLPSEGCVAILHYRLEASPNLKSSSRSKRSKQSKHAKVPADLRKRVGLVLQFPEHQMFEQTIEQDLRFGPKNFGASEAEASVAAHRAASAIGLEEQLLRSSPFQVSSGQMRKAAIASVLATDPDIIVLDEPTASLDQLSREDLLQLLHGLCREQGKTVVIVTHRLEEVLPYVDQFVVMSEGKAIFQGDVGQLQKLPGVLEKAGVDPPPSFQLLTGIADRLEAELPATYLDAEQMASWISGKFGWD